MDTSISKALIMVAGVLLAMIVIAFVAHSFMQIGSWATTQDDEVLIAQKEKFNKEYEVYDKKLMYGVDVISCLNKALSNNDKINNRQVINGELYDETYEVSVKVTLKGKPLEESMKVYHMVNGKEMAYEKDKGPTNIKLEDTDFNFIKDINDNRSYVSKISNLNQNSQLRTEESLECKQIGTIAEFNLTKDEDAQGETELRALLTVSNALSEIVKNPNKGESGKETSWTKAEFRTALYDLKTRKFRCTNITYSASGRVNFIKFQEI